MRYLFLHYGMGDSKAYFYNGIALATSFFLVRIVTISILLIHVACNWWFIAYKKGLYWSRPRSERLLFGGLTLLLLVHGALNVFWFWKIVQHALRTWKRQLIEKRKTN
mmetsp:Transcript_9079/g.11899  ORF Transcript_9079/g.11899 Transcript_9079/m.11899 type:complete len:108 (-) Transcript_9079:6-329(-)